MPTWRDTAPVDPFADAPIRRKRKPRRAPAPVTPEPTRGGVSHKKPMPWAVAFLIAACIMAFAAGSERHAEKQWHYADKSKADQGLCNYSPNGPVVNVTVYNTDPYTWYVHCKDGITMTQSAPINP